MNKRLKIYSIDTSYIYSLKQFDTHVCNHKEEHDYERPYVGILVFETSNFYYFAPLTSQKNKSDFYCVKLNDQQGEPVGGVLINNMIPIPKEALNLFSMINVQTYLTSPLPADQDYGELLRNEILDMNTENRNTQIHKKAKRFYRDYKYDKSIHNVCNDFKLLEEKALKYVEKK